MPQPVQGQKICDRHHQRLDGHPARKPRRPVRPDHRKGQEPERSGAGTHRPGDGGWPGSCSKTKDPAVVRDVAQLVKASTGKVGLVPFTVTKIQPVGMGDRVCVDTCSMLADGEGMLMGNTSSAMLLVHAETLENPYVAPRPFRVNAGAVHAYILLPDGKTAYLSDLAIGGQVLVTDAQGTAHPAIIGRTKIERRPLLLVEAEAGRAKVSLILQNAETIRLVKKDGGAVSVVSLAVGDTVMGCTLEGGRHFGMAVKETIREQ